MVEVTSQHQCAESQFEIMSTLKTIEYDPIAYINNLTMNGELPPTGCKLSIENNDYEMYCDFTHMDGAMEFKASCENADGHIVPMDLDTKCGSTVELANMGMCVSNTCSDEQYLTYINHMFDIIQTFVERDSPGSQVCALNMTNANGMEHTGGITVECLASGGVIAEVDNALNLLNNTGKDDLPGKSDILGE